MSKATSGLRGSVLERYATLERAEDRSAALSAVVSSETPVRTMFGDEILDHSPGAVDLSRDAGNGLPLLYEHGDRIGRARGFALGEDRKLRAELHVSGNSQLARDVGADVADGVLDAVSVRYRVNEFEDGPGESYRVTDWTLLEVSVVAVPADAAAGIGRSIEGSVMDDRNGPRYRAADGNVAELDEARRTGEREGARLERERRTEVDSLFERFPGHDDLRKRAIDGGWTVDQARRELLEALEASNGREGDSTYRQDARGGSMDGQTARDVQSGDDERDRWAEGCRKALHIRAGLIEDKAEVRKERAESEFTGMSLADMARAFLELERVSMRGKSRDQICGMALERAGTHTTSDFPSILKDTANLSMLRGWEAAEERWNLIVRPEPVPDFKVNTFAALSLFPSLDQVNEAGEFTYKSLEDVEETMQLATYGNLLTISRQALINDSQGFFSSAPRNMGQAASRRIGDLVWGVLTANANMVQDGQPLFDASHNNIGTAGIPSVDTVDEARVGMGLQQDPNGVVIGLRPALMMVPLELETTANTLVQAEFDPATTAGTLLPNAVRDSYVPVADHRLSTAAAAAGTLEWYMSSNPNNTDAIIVGFLNGVSEPFLDQQTGWTVDGSEWKVRIDAAAIPGDFRGLWKNPGLAPT